MEHLEFEFILKSKSPIAHHSESFGNSSILMRKRVRQPDGALVDVPIITGDTMRHGLREASSYALLEAADLLGENLTESALRLLFSGGMVTGGGSQVRLDDYRRWTELMPPLSILGGCAGNRVIQGQIQVDEALLVCDETEPHLSDWALDQIEGPLSSARSLTEEVQRVRMDPTLSPEKRKLLEVSELEQVEQRLLDSEEATEDDNPKAKEESKSSMMPRRHQRVIQGSLWWWSLTGIVYNELERDTLLTMLAAFLGNAVVGGKRGTGHGKLEAVSARQIDLGTWKKKSQSLALQESSIGDLFRSHVEERSQLLLEMLQGIRA